MRQLGTLGDVEAARKFAVALRERGIQAEFRSEPTGEVAVWVVDEDRIEDAGAELRAFEADPGRYPDVTQAPVPDRMPMDSDRFGPVRKPAQSVWKRVPVTIALVVAALGATAWTDFGRRADRFAALAISSEIVSGDWSFGDHLRDIRRGEIWRLFTPALVHGDWIHLLGNLGALWVLGGAVESVRGSLRFLGLVLLIGVVSNVAEYWLDIGMTFDSSRGFGGSFGVHPSPLFLGMSGVVFGLFGLIWMRARFVPESRFVMPRDLVVWMLIWLLACTAGMVGNVANVAHGAGLLTGMAVGLAPRLRRRAGPNPSA